MKHHCDDMRCMRDLTVKQVLKAAHRWLREKNKVFLKKGLQYFRLSCILNKSAVEKPKT